MTRRLSFARAALAALAGIFIVPLGASAAGNEQRCNELGAGCVCNEPLNAGDNLPAEPDRHWNPSDTTTKECDGENGNGQAMVMPGTYSSAANVRASAAGVPFPSGADPYVYRGPLGSIQQLHADAMYNVDEETVCHRVYRRYSKDAPPPPDTNYRIKNLQLGHLAVAPYGHIDLQHTFDGSGNAYIQVVDPFYSAPDVAYGVPQFHQKCQAGWCRLEVCADQIGTHLYYRYRVAFLATGEVLTFNSDAGEGPSSTDFAYNVAHMFVQGSLPGSQFMSYQLLSRVPKDQNFWIGPAYELEGGGGTPIPPPPAPPVAPVLGQ